MPPGRSSYRHSVRRAAPRVVSPPIPPGRSSMLDYWRLGGSSGRVNLSGPLGEVIDNVSFGCVRNRRPSAPGDGAAARRQAPQDPARLRPPYSPTVAAG
jgi:hypothetical protein